MRMKNANREQILVLWVWHIRNSAGKSLAVTLWQILHSWRLVQMWSFNGATNERDCNALELPWSIRGQNHLGLQQWASSPQHFHSDVCLLKMTMSLCFKGNFSIHKDAFRKPQWSFESGHLFSCHNHLRNFSGFLKILFI